MKREKKSHVLEGLKERFAKSNAVVLADFQGIKVDRLQAIGREMKQNGAGIFQVAKNTLAYLAMEGTPSEPLRQYLKGQTAVAFALGDPSAMAKVISKYTRGEQESDATLRIKRGILEGELIDSAVILHLASLPSRKELLAKMVGTIAAPLQSLVNVLQAPMRDLVYALKAIEGKKGEQK